MMLLPYCSPTMMDRILSCRRFAPFQLPQVSTSTSTSTSFSSPASCFSVRTKLSRFSRGPGCPAATGRSSVFFGLMLNGYLSQSWQYLTANKKPESRSKQQQQSGRYGPCRATLADETPYALAIGASILSTVILPTVGADRDPRKEDESLLGPDEVLSGAMQIISFIPLFNWLVWVLVWLDSRKPLYLVFSVVYLAPYLKTGLSLSPEDSWLPIGSLLACVAHVQIYLSISRGNRF